ncbi:MAG: zinc ABC transporter substrate-binding protein [Lachnospiraceae bacterium]|nr:zinc ABC transporter substrate-binding protein [Lachnospiraceae bacterium]
MKRFIKKLSFILVLVFALGLTSCGKLSTSDSGKIKIVCTTFPQYDWVKEIAGDRAEELEIILLGNGGIDLHSYQPTADDIVTISDCDVFIYNGGVSDSWVESTLDQATNEDMIVINMMLVLEDRLREEEIVEGMEVHHHEDGEEHSEEEHINVAEYDEHVWLSLTNATLVCDAITEALSNVDKDNSSVYDTNNKTYQEKLVTLDTEYKNAVATAKYDTLLFGDRFPFIYMLKDYEINYYAAFTGCSSESEASFETIAFLADKMDELALPAIMVVDGSTDDLANTILESAKSSGQKILVIDSMQNVSDSDVKSGKSYIETMENNLTVLKTALGCE